MFLKSGLIHTSKAARFWLRFRPRTTTVNNIETSLPRAMSLMPHSRRAFPWWNHALDEYDPFRHYAVKEGHGALSYTPLLDVHETKDNYHLDVDLPGVEKKDIDIQFSDHNTVQIKGHSEHEKMSEDPEHSWIYSERSAGDFKQSFNFPVMVDDDHVDATLKNGVLSITVPKAQKSSETKRIGIK